MKNWTDEKILDYLMSSDYEENLSPEDLKFLLFKFKYYYRIVSGRTNNLVAEREQVINQLILSIEQKEIELKHLIQQNNSIKLEYDMLINKKLTLKERFFGKIQNAKKF